MKRFSLFAAISALIVAGCTPAEEVLKPVFTSTTEGEIAAASEGGSYSLTYSLENPASDGKVEAVPDEGAQEWINDFDYSEDGIVSFNVDANEAEEDREARITVTYTCSVAEPQSFDVTLVQAGKTGSVTPPPAESPELTLTSESEVEVDMKGGDFEITYALENPVDGGKIEVKSDSWITADDNGKSINVHIGENDSDEARSGKVTVSYVWEGGEPLSFAVTFNQGARVMTDLTFDVTVTPSPTSVSIKVVPSDKEAPYLAAVIDDAYYNAGYTDEEIMEDICERYSSSLAGSVNRGDREFSTSIEQDKQYYAIVFGVDLNTGSYNSALKSVPFTATPARPTDAYAVGNMDNYWDSEELAAWDSRYAPYVRDDKPVLAVLEFEYNDEAAGASYYIWTGDFSQVDPETFRDVVISSGSKVTKGEPAAVGQMSYNVEYTICTVAFDEDGNYGDISVTPVLMTEDGVSKDYALFDWYFDAYMYGGASSSSAPVGPYVSGAGNLDFNFNTEYARIDCLSLIK